MSTQLQLKRSAVPAKVPTTAQMVVGEIAVNTYDGTLFLRGNNGADFVQQIGGSSSSSYPVIGGLGQSWQPVAGAGPIESFEYDENVWLFTQASSQALVLWAKVPNAYTAGRQIFLRQCQYSPGTANNTKMQTSTALVRKNLDTITAIANSRTSTNGDNLLSVTSNQYQEVIYDLTDSLGKINSVAVSPGDLLKITLTRTTPTGVEDSNDVRMIPSSTEILF